MAIVVDENLRPDSLVMICIDLGPVLWYRPQLFLHSDLYHIVECFLVALYFVVEEYPQKS